MALCVLNYLYCNYLLSRVKIRKNQINSFSPWLVLSFVKNARALILEAPQCLETEEFFIICFPTDSSILMSYYLPQGNIRVFWCLFKGEKKKKRLSLLALH